MTNLDVTKTGDLVADPEPTPTAPAGRSSARSFGAALDFAALGVVLIGLVVVFSISSQYFLERENIINILDSVSVTGMIAAPVTMLMISGKFDLSVGSSAAFASAVLVMTAGDLGLPGAVLLAVAAPIGVGLVNAYLVSMLRISSLVASIGTLSIFAGLAKVLTDGQSLSLNGFSALGSVRLPGGIPISVLIFAAMSILTFLVLRYTVFGRSLYATGSNQAAARLNGIGVTRLTFVTYALVGLGVALGALVLSSQISGYEPSMADNLEVSVLTAIVLGGASLEGGRGSMIGTVLGLLLVGIMNNGLVLLNVGSFWQGVAQGALLIGAVAFAQLRKGRTRDNA